MVGTKFYLHIDVDEEKEWAITILQFHLLLHSLRARTTLREETLVV